MRNVSFLVNRGNCQELLEKIENISMLIWKDIKCGPTKFNPYSYYTNDPKIYIDCSIEGFLSWGENGTHDLLINADYVLNGTYKIDDILNPTGTTTSSSLKEAKDRLDSIQKNADFDIHNISDEDFREYYRPGDGFQYRIEKPSKLYLKSGSKSHRVLDQEGVVHYVHFDSDTVIRWRTNTDKPVLF